MTSFVLYILATVISIQYVSSVPPDPAAVPAVEQQVDPSVITPIDTVAVPNEAPVTPVQEPVAQAAPATPVCDGSQVIYATPPSQDTITGMPNGPGLDAITLSNDGINTFLSNKIGIASNMGQLVPDQQPESEIIRSGSIDPLTGNLVLLYQEINPMDPTMSEPNQRLIIIPVFKLNSLLVESPALLQTGAAAGVVGSEAAVAPGLEAQLPQAQRPGILAYELEQEIDLSEVEVGDQIPLTEIAFDCAGNLLGITLEGELVQMIIEAGNSNLEMDYIGRVEFQGPVVGLSQGFVGLTYDFQTNAFVAVGGLMGKTLVQFQVVECTVFQIGNPIIITDNDNLCPQGIVSIAARGDNQYYVTCVDTAVGPMAMGLAVLELQGGTATILPLNAAQGQTLVPLPNSSGGAIIPSIPSTTGNSICFPRSIQSTPPTCNVLPADTDCQGDIQMQQVFPPAMAAPGASVNGGTTGLVPPPGAQITVGAAPVNGQVGGIPQPQLNGVAGGYGSYGAQGAGSYANGVQGGTSFNGVVVPGTDTANGQAAANGVNGANGEGLSSSGSGSSSSGSGSSASSGSSGSTSGSSTSGSSGSASSESDDDSTSGSSSTSDGSSGNSGDSTDESVSGSGNSASDDDSDNSGSDDSSDDNSDDSNDSSGTESGADDNNSGNDDDSATEDDDDDEDDQESGNDGGSTDSNSLDDSGDESEDDDNNASQSSSSSEERESGDDALSNGNDFHQNGFVSAQEYGSNGNGTMISLSPSTLANLWGLAMIFLGINVTFLFVCYYRNGNCKKNQVTMDDDMDADIESL